MRQSKNRGAWMLFSGGRSAFCCAWRFGRVLPCCIYTGINNLNVHAFAQSPLQNELPPPKSLREFHTMHAPAQLQVGDAGSIALILCCLKILCFYLLFMA
jgi:hypothetical protein